LTVTAHTPRPPASIAVSVPVVQERVIPIRFVVVRDSAGNNAAASLARVQRDFEAANKLWQQAGIRFEWIPYEGQPLRFVDNTEYLDADPFDRAELLSTYPAVGGFKAYYVRTCPQESEPNYAGLWTQWGVFVCTTGPPAATSRVLAHELGHSLIGLGHRSSSIYLMYHLDSGHHSDITLSEFHTMIARAEYSHQ
jgi:hypothetical protein